MSLATRCTSCGTVFRVVQDQLKVSEGWVRCGRCNEVFNALEGLFDLDRETPPPWPAEAKNTAQSADALEEAFAADASDPALVDRIDAAVFGQRTSDRSGQRGAAPAAPEPEPGRLPAVSWDSPAPEPAMPIADWDVERPGAPPAGEVDAPAPPPEFVRHAERAARWQSRGARTALGAAGAVLALALATQAALHFRDGIAARWPAARPLLALLCQAPACRIEPPRRIEDVSVESTALTRAGGADAFRLAVTLRNRGALAVSLPSVDLSLTDSAGQLVARRALAPRDFHVASPVLQPGAEAALQLQLSAGTPRVTGYTVEIFYP